MDRLLRGISKQNSRAYDVKKDNRGSSIVIVIIAMGMVGILATSILWTSYMGYRIKINDISNKKSFYTAEVVLEQILAGVQTESARAVATAYKKVLTGWDELENESNRFNVFANTYLEEMQKVYDTAMIANPDAAPSGQYDRSVIAGYVDSAAFAMVDTTQWTAKPAILQKVDNSLIMKDICVSFDDTANDRVSMVSTDICIEVPQLNFRQAGDFNYDYVMIGNQGIEFQGAGIVETTGSMYAGVDASGMGGLIINPGITVNVNDGKQVISKGDVELKGPSTSFVVRAIPNNSGSVYCRNLKVDSAVLSLDSRTYVENDLLLTGNGSKVTLNKEYFGYGTSTNNDIDKTNPDDDVKPDESSAIIINGKNSTVDLSGLNRLVLAGRAYIGQNVNALGTNTGSQVMMGESIAVKGGQIAYLVPAECIGLAQDSVVIGQNPITKVQAENIVNKVYENKYKDSLGNTFFKEIDFAKKLTKLGGKSLSDFGVSDMKHIRKVHTQYRGSELVYYYVVLDSNNATDYFRQFYNVNANKKSIDEYFRKYASGGIMLGDFEAGTTEYTILGNSLVSDAPAGSVKVVSKNKGGETNTPPKNAGDYEEVSDNIDKENNFSTEAEVLNRAALIRNDYKALTTNLTTDISTVDPSSNVFNNFVKEPELTAYLAANGGEVTFEADGRKAIFTNHDKVITNLDSDVRLVVSLGDVEVQSSFEGLIVAKGKITVKSASVPTIKYDKNGLFKVLSGESTLGDHKIPLEFFVNSGTSVTNPTAVSVDDTGTALIDYSDIVRYENWIKK